MDFHIGIALILLTIAGLCMAYRFLMGKLNAPRFLQSEFACLIFIFLILIFANKF